MLGGFDMHRILTGILGLLVLYFAADHARLQNRLRFLEERLAAAPVRAPRPTPVVERGMEIVPVPTPVPSVAAPALTPAASAAPSAAPDLTPLVRANEFLTSALTAVDQFAEHSKQIFTPIESRDPYASLNLASWQKGAVDAILARRDARTAELEAAIARVHEDAERDIAAQLTPEQRATYEVRKNLPSPQEAAEAGPNAPAAAAHGFLGVSGSNAQGGGVTFSEIIPNTAASGAGLLVGDTLLEFNDVKVADYAALALMVQALPADSPVNLKIRRKGTEFTRAVLLGRR